MDWREGPRWRGCDTPLPLKEGLGEGRVSDVQSQMNQKSSSSNLTEAPRGTPDWITPESIRDTLETWQPHYSTPLSINDAIQILTNVRNLLRLLDPN